MSENKHPGIVKRIDKPAPTKTIDHAEIEPKIQELIDIELANYFCKRQGKTNTESLEKLLTFVRNGDLLGLKNEIEKLEKLENEQTILANHAALQNAVNERHNRNKQEELEELEVKDLKDFNKAAPEKTPIVKKIVNENGNITFIPEIPFKSFADPELIEFAEKLKLNECSPPTETTTETPTETPTETNPDFIKLAEIVKNKDINALREITDKLQKEQNQKDKTLSALEEERARQETSLLLSRIKECPNPHQKECLDFAKEQQALRIKNKQKTYLNEAFGANSQLAIAKQYFDINQKEIEKQLEDVVALYSVKDKKPFYFISQPEARLAIDFIKENRKTNFIETKNQQLRYNIVEDSLKLLPAYIKRPSTQLSPINITKKPISNKESLASEIEKYGYIINPYNKFLKTPQDVLTKPITEEKFSVLFSNYLSLFKYQNTVTFDPSGLKLKSEKTKNKNNENVSQNLSDTDLNQMFAVVEEKDLFVTHIITHAKILAQLRNLRCCFNDATSNERSKFPLLMGYALEREVLIFNHIPENTIFLVAFKQNMNLPDNVNEYNDESEIASLTPHLFQFVLNFRK